MSQHLTQRGKLKVSIGWRMTWWWVGNLIYGLLPLWILGIANFLPVGQKTKELCQGEWSHLIRDGVINFFCLAIMGAIGIDIFIQRRTFDDNFGTIMIAFAIAPFVALIIIFLIMILGSDGVNNFGNINWLRIGICTYAFVYCTVGKTVLFLKELKQKP